MRLLFDTHAVVWWLTADARLSPAARRAITSPAADLAVSAASVWELSIKRASGKYEGIDPAVALTLPGVSELAITAAHGSYAASLPVFHRDPFDRVILAQAFMEDRVLVTRDATLTRYGCATIC